MLLVRLLEESPAEKIAVFSTFGATVRYLDRASARASRRTRAGRGDRRESTSPDERTGALARFAPETVVYPGYEPPDGEVDLLLSTDVLSEGQNLQQAQAVISYDMPWNPQRVVQRNGRVIRLLSRHDEVFLTTMLPTPGELEKSAWARGADPGKDQGRERRLRHGVGGHRGGRSRAAQLRRAPRRRRSRTGAGGRGGFRRLRRRGTTANDRPRDLRGRGRACAAPTVGYRRLLPPIARGALSGGVGNLLRHPHAAGGRPEDGYRYWRYVEVGGDLVDGDLEILRRIDPQGAEPSEIDGIDLDAAWDKAASSIVAEHNSRADLRAGQEQIGPLQRWALEVLRDPTVTLPVGSEQVDEADAALSVERSSAIRRALRKIQDRLDTAEISRDKAATEIVEVVAEFGLRPVDPPPLPERIGVDDLGVVCWMVVLPSG